MDAPTLNGIVLLCGCAFVAVVIGVVFWYLFIRQPKQS